MSAAKSVARLTGETEMARYIGVSEQSPEFGLQTITLWSGAFMSEFEGRGRELPKHDGFMVEFAFLPGSPKVRVECPAPRNDENYEQVDAAIQAAFETTGGLK